MGVVLTSSEVLKELQLSRSTFYYLLKNNLIAVPTNGKGRYVWDEALVTELKEKLRAYEAPAETETPYKTVNISNRRYLGNKYKLLDFIRRTVAAECPDVTTVADIFAGTGSVASAFSDKKIIVNDLLYFNHVCHVAWFGAEKYDEEKIRNLICYYNAVSVTADNYMSENFADTFFSLNDCRKIGFIREDIEVNFRGGKINARERAILITSLLYAMDKIANTCGHYDAYIKGAKFEKELELCVPIASNDNNENNQCCNEDANLLVRRIDADLVYIDPPYNSRQYCDAYHLLENVARWEKPAVHGVALKMDRTALKSDYCTSSAAKAFEALISDIKARYIVLSYNNMAEKGNERSNAKISDDDIMRILSRKGKVKIFSEEYRAFNAGKSHIKGNRERLFVCECYGYGQKAMIQSPLNYTGGKYRLLPQILPHFPKDINCFVDLFCGGGNVGMNVSCNKVIFNDKNPLLKRMFETFRTLDKETTFAKIDAIIRENGLSDTSANGYEAYGCTSASGLAAYNGEKFLKLREKFNGMTERGEDYYITLYVLIVFAFNNQIRFNRKGQYNLPVGKRDFNKNMREKLSLFIDRLKSGDYRFENLDFRELPCEDWDEKTFVYADPPYLITCATYNEQDGWNESLERELLSYLDGLHERGIRFALSNVLRSKGKENTVLTDWINRNMGKYRVIYLDYSYSNSNYHTKDRTSGADEVLVVND